MTTTPSKKLILQVMLKVTPDFQAAIIEARERNGGCTLASLVRIALVNLINQE